MKVERGCARREEPRALRRADPRRGQPLRHVPLHGDRGEGRPHRPRGHGLEGRRGPALLPDEPRPHRAAGHRDDRERVHRADHQDAPDGVRGRAEPADRAEHGGLGRLTGHARFTPAASLALGGPDWLVERRLAAAEQLADVAWPTASEEIWRYSRIDELDLDRYRPTDRGRDRSRRVETAPGGGVLAAEAGERAGLVVVRNGRVVHHELDDRLVAKGVVVCGLATCEGEDVASVARARAPTRRPTRSPCSTTRSSRAARSSGCRRAWSSRSRSSSCTGPTATGWRPFPHTLVVAEEQQRGHRPGPLRLARTSRAAPRRRRSSSSSSATTRTLQYLSVQEHGPRTWSDRAAARARRARRVAALVGGRARRRLRPAAQRVAAHRRGRRERPAGGLLRRPGADARLPHPAGPRRAAHPQRPAVQGRGRGQGPLGLLRAHPAPARGAEGERLPDQPQPRAHRGRRAPSRSRTSRSRRTTCSARTRRPSARSTTTSSTTSRAAACRPTTPSGSSCSASSRTSSPACPIPSLARALRRSRCTRRSEHRPWRLTSRVCSVDDVARRRRSGASTSTVTGCASCTSSGRLVRDRRPVLARGRVAVRGRPVDRRVRDRVPEARLDVRSCAPASRRRCPRPSRCRSTRSRSNGDDVVVTLPMSTLTIAGPARRGRRPRDPARASTSSCASGEVHALMGPNGSGKSHARPRPDGPGRLRGHGGSVHARRRGAARAAHVAARRSRAVPVDPVPGGDPRRAGRGPARTARGRAEARATASSVPRLRAEAERPRASPTSSSSAGVNIEFSGGEQKRAETLQLAVLEPKFAVLDELDSGLDVDALRDVVPPHRGDDRGGRARRARDHALRPAAHRAASRRVHVFMAGRVIASGGPELADELERPATTASPSASASTTLTVEAPTAEADPFADPGF